MRDLPRREPPFPAFLIAVGFVAAMGLVLALRPRTVPVVPDAGANAAGTRGDGTNIVVRYGCLECHSVTPDNGTPARAPSLAGALRRGSGRIEEPDYGGGAVTAEEYVRESVRDHCAHVVDGFDCEGVRVYGNWMSSEEIDEVIGFVASLPEGEPPP